MPRPGIWDVLLPLLHQTFTTLVGIGFLAPLAYCSGSILALDDQDNDCCRRKKRPPPQPSAEALLPTSNDDPRSTDKPTIGAKRHSSDDFSTDKGSTDKPTLGDRTSFFFGPNAPLPAGLVDRASTPAEVATPSNIQPKSIDKSREDHLSKEKRSGEKKKEKTSAEEKVKSAERKNADKMNSRESKLSKMERPKKERTEKSDDGETEKKTIEMFKQEDAEKESIINNTTAATSISNAASLG